MSEITISVPDDLMAELAAAAQEDGRTEPEVVSEALVAFLTVRRAGLSVPPFARRIGPLAVPEAPPPPETSAT